MTETAIQDHGLDAFLNPGSGDSAGVMLTIRSDVGHINLRGDPDNPKFLKATEKALGQPLPAAANTISSGASDILWLGPNEWLILSTSTETDTLAKTLEKALVGIHSAVNVVSGGQIAMTLSGENVRELIAKGCTIDLHPGAFKDGMCVQSGLTKANVVIGLVNDDEFIVIVRRSFSDYLLRWLSDAAAEYGMRVAHS